MSPLNNSLSLQLLNAFTNLQKSALLNIRNFNDASMQGDNTKAMQALDNVEKCMVELLDLRGEILARGLLAYNMIRLNPYYNNDIKKTSSQTDKFGIVFTKVLTNFDALSNILFRFYKKVNLFFKDELIKKRVQKVIQPIFNISSDNDDFYDLQNINGNWIEPRGWYSLFTSINTGKIYAYDYPSKKEVIIQDYKATPIDNWPLKTPVYDRQNLKSGNILYLSQNGQQLFEVTAKLEIVSCQQIPIPGCHDKVEFAVSEENLRAFSFNNQLVIFDHSMAQTHSITFSHGTRIRRPTYIQDALYFFTEQAGSRYARLNRLSNSEVQCLYIGLCRPTCIEGSRDFVFLADMHGMYCHKKDTFCTRNVSIPFSAIFSDLDQTFHTAISSILLKNDILYAYFHRYGGYNTDLQTIEVGIPMKLFGGRELDL